MSMPSSLILVRHGESEANIVNKAFKNNLLDVYPPSFESIPDREMRLSAKGVSQAQDTGRFLNEAYPQGVDVIYVSDHIRAKETAAQVCMAAGWNDVEILIDPLLGERNWGAYHKLEKQAQQAIMALRKRDPLHLVMPDGESMLDTRVRAKLFLDRLARQYTEKRVLVFSHGEYIEALWAEIEHMHTERELEFFESPEGDIKNCQVIEFEAAPVSHNRFKFTRRRSCNPYLKDFTQWSWVALRRDKFTPRELLDLVNKYPPQDFEDFVRKNAKPE